MIIVPVIQAEPNTQVVVPITVTPEQIAGVQFIMSFDPAALSYVSFAGSSGLTQANETEPGQVSCIIADSAILSNPVCEITFNVVSSSTLTLSSVIGSSSIGTDIPLTVQDGEIIVGGNMSVNVTFQWVNNNPPEIEVIDQTVYQSDQADPAAGENSGNPKETRGHGSAESPQAERS